MFYISSQGHSATAWLTRNLNLHPNIICWHGVRSIPPYYPGTCATLNPTKLIDALEICEKNAFEINQFGICHAGITSPNYEIKIKQAIERKNGKFFAIFRNPLARVNSIFSSLLAIKLTYGNIVDSGIKINYKNFLVENENSINEYFNKQNTKDINRKKKIKKLDLNRLTIAKRIYRKFSMIKNKYIKELFKKKYKNELDFDKILKNKEISDLDFDKISKNEKIIAIVNTYMSACIRTFDTDSKIAQNCDFEQIFKMEDFVTSQDYFKEIFYKISGIKADPDFLKKVFDFKEHINFHSNYKNLNLIFKNWPSCFKKDFMEKLNNCSAKKFYDKLGYGVLLDKEPLLK